MSLLLKASNGHLFLSSSIASMATCSSFCAQLPIHFRPIPIASSFPTNQPFKPFSAQASISPANGIFCFASSSSSSLCTIQQLELRNFMGFVF
jgi:hypothetical protein